MKNSRAPTDDASRRSLNGAEHMVVPIIGKSYFPKRLTAFPRQGLVEVATLPPWSDQTKIKDCLVWCRGATAEHEAAHIIASRWRAEAEEYDLDPINSVAEESLLSVADLRAIARKVSGGGEVRK